MKTLLLLLIPCAALAGDPSWSTSYSHAHAQASAQAGAAAGAYSGGNTLTGGDATTIYAVKFGEPYLSGFHLNDIRVEDKGELEDGVSVRTIIDWTPGIYHVHPRSIARLVGIVAA